MMSESKGTPRASVVQRLERFFRLADLWCSACEEFHGDAEEFGVVDKANWDEQMGAEVAWILNNRWQVRDALPALEGEWAATCDSVRFLMQQAEAPDAARCPDLAVDSGTVFEFHFDESETDDPGPLPTEDVVDRLEGLLDAARKMRQAGWPMWFTITGLAFEVPGDDPDNIEEVAQRLSDIGIDRPFVFSSRSPAELAEAVSNLHDRVWYERKLVWIHSAGFDRAEEMRERPDIIRGMLRGMHEVEQRGLEEEFPVECDFDWGWSMVSSRPSGGHSEVRGTCSTPEQKPALLV
jgi:hypothetical protein